MITLTFCLEHPAPLVLGFGPLAGPRVHVEGGPGEEVQHFDLGQIQVDENLGDLLAAHGSAQAVLDFLATKYEAAMTVGGLGQPEIQAPRESIFDSRNLTETVEVDGDGDVMPIAGLRGLVVGALEVDEDGDLRPRDERHDLGHFQAEQARLEYDADGDIMTIA